MDISTKPGTELETIFFTKQECGDKSMQPVTKTSMTNFSINHKNNSLV